MFTRLGLLRIVGEPVAGEQGLRVVGVCTRVPARPDQPLARTRQDLLQGEEISGVPSSAAGELEALEELLAYNAEDLDGLRAVRRHLATLEPL